VRWEENFPITSPPNYSDTAFQHKQKMPVVWGKTDRHIREETKPNVIIS